MSRAPFPRRSATPWSPGITSTCVSARSAATMATKVELAEAKGEILKWLFGAVGVQTLAILGGVAALFRLLR